jgi:hypothetical protein
VSPREDHTQPQRGCHKGLSLTTFRFDLGQDFRGHSPFHKGAAPHPSSLFKITATPLLSQQHDHLGVQLRNIGARASRGLLLRTHPTLSGITFVIKIMISPRPLTVVFELRFHSDGSNLQKTPSVINIINLQTERVGSLRIVSKEIVLAVLGVRSHIETSPQSDKLEIWEHVTSLSKLIPTKNNNTLIGLDLNANIASTTKTNLIRTRGMIDDLTFCHQHAMGLQLSFTHMEARRQSYPYRLYCHIQSACCPHSQQ